MSKDTIISMLEQIDNDYILFIIHGTVEAGMILQSLMNDGAMETQGQKGLSIES